MNLNHGGKTTIRFSINTDKIINSFEHRTPLIKSRLEAAYKVSESGYKLGFIIAPVFLYDKWKEDYGELILMLNEYFKGKDISFEIISHRFTKRAKENIKNVFPKTFLPLEEEIRDFKYGQFGYGKYLYKKDELQYMKEFFKENLSKHFHEDSINYII